MPQRRTSIKVDKVKQLEVLYSHYAETFELLKNYVGKRDRLFLYTLIVISLLLLYMNAPHAISDWLNSFLRSQAGGNNQLNPSSLIDTSFIGGVLLLGLLSLCHTYFQTVLHIERQYDYIYQLEKRLSDSLGDEIFAREGKHYKEHKRSFATWTKFIYWYLFPVLFFTFIIAWLVFLFTRSEASISYLIVDSFLLLSILVSLVLYFRALIRKK